MSNVPMTEPTEWWERVADIASILTPDQWKRISREQYDHLDELDCFIREGAEKTPRVKGDMYFRGAAARVFAGIAAELETIG